MRRQWSFWSSVADPGSVDVPGTGVGFRTAAPRSVRLIATDLDGTLLRSDQTVSPRTRAALDTARAAGIQIVPVTARQPRGVRRIAEMAGFGGWALCGNGAYGVHLGTGETLFTAHVEIEAQLRLATLLSGRVPGGVILSRGDWR